MSELFELLKQNTSDKGAFTIYFNDHKTYYEEPEKYYKENEEIVDFTKDIYQLIWFKGTPVGSYDIISNSLNDLLIKVKEIIGGFNE